MTTVTGGNLEGLGGQVQLDSYTYDGIDPALDECCRREVESNRKQNALTSTLRRHDVSIAAERRRLRNIISTPQFDGCRCCYDPSSDGGEYRALVNLKAEKKELLADIDEKKENQGGEEDGDDPSKLNPNDNNGDDDSDDEFDYLLDEGLPGGDGSDIYDPELKAIEDRRRAELEYEMMVRQIAQHHGYGVHRQLHPLRVLKAAGLTTERRGMPPFAVIHLVDPDSRGSASLDYFLETVLSTENPGTVFLRSGGRSTLLMNNELARKVLPSTVTNPDRDLPALVAVRDGVACMACPRLEGLVKYGSDVDGEDGGEVSTIAVREWLENCGVLNKQPPRMDELCFIRPEEEALIDSGYMPERQSSSKGRKIAAAAIEEERYDCGVEGCCKSFKHEHVGIQTTEQSGLVVSEETILNTNVES